MYFECVQDSKKKREEERQKQIRWREEHRNALLQGHDSLDTGDSSNGRINRAPTFPGGRGGGQMFRQKRWQRGTRSGMFHTADSQDTQDTQDSNMTHKYRDASQDDLLDTHPGTHDTMSTLPLESAQRSPTPRSDRSPTGAYGHHAPRDRQMLDDTVHLIDFGAGEREALDLVHSRSPSPGNRDHIMSGSASPGPGELGMLPTDDMEGSLGSLRHRRDSMASLSRHSSAHSLQSITRPPTADFSVQVEESDDGGSRYDRPGSQASSRFSQPPSRASTVDSQPSIGRRADSTPQQPSDASDPSASAPLVAPPRRLSRRSTMAEPEPTPQRSLESLDDGDGDDDEDDDELGPRDLKSTRV